MFFASFQSKDLQPQVDRSHKIAHAYSGKRSLQYANSGIGSCHFKRDHFFSLVALVFEPGGYHFEFAVGCNNAISKVARVAAMLNSCTMCDTLSRHVTVLHQSWPNHRPKKNDAKSQVVRICQKSDLSVIQQSKVTCRFSAHLNSSEKP